ncbi:MAG: GNAT family N-acetyltransferase [Sphingomonadales bacterium]|nr:GNAT family N-acetyltransferase [Sphingomonadales bacterium]
MPVLQLVRRLPGYSGEIGLDGIQYPVSQLRLHQPQGHYIHGLWLRLANALLNRGGLRGVGHPCVPGLFFPHLDQSRGYKQINGWPRGLTTLAVNVTGTPPIPQAVTFEAEPYMALQLRPEWTKFEHYTQAMKSKYRLRVRKVIDSSATLERCICHGSTDSAWLNQAGQLLSSTLATRVVALTENIPAMLLSFSAVFGPDFLMYRYSLNDEPVGFVTGLKIDDTLHALHLGYDAERTEGIHLYERCLLDMIDTGIQMGVKTVQMGRTATEIKSALGAVPVQNSLVFFVRNPVFRLLLRAYARYIYQPPPYTLRHPFTSPQSNANANQLVGILAFDR